MWSLCDSSVKIKEQKRNVHHFLEYLLSNKLIGFTALEIIAFTFHLNHWQHIHILSNIHFLNKSCENK